GLRAREVGQAPRGEEGPEAALQHLPPRLDELGVADGEERGIVVVEELARRPSWSGQGAELGITHRALARLVEGAAHPRRREIAGLGAEPDEHTLRRVEGDLDSHTVHL